MLRSLEVVIPILTIRKKKKNNQMGQSENSVTFLGLIGEVRSQGTLLPWNAVNRWIQRIWFEISYLELKPPGTLKWQFRWIAGGWVWSSMCDNPLPPPNTRCHHAIKGRGFGVRCMPFYEIRPNSLFTFNSGS